MKVVSFFKMMRARIEDLFKSIYDLKVLWGKTQSEVLSLRKEVEKLRVDLVCQDQFDQVHMGIIDILNDNSIGPFQQVEQIREALSVQ